MKVIRVERDETLERVATRLTPNASADQLKRVVEALQRANPVLAERAGAGEELVLTIPADVQVVRPARQEGARVDVILGDVQDRLGQVTNMVSERTEREEKNAAEALARLDSGEVARLARERPALAAQVAAVRDAAGARAREAAAVRELQVAALAQVSADLTSLARLAAEGSALGSVLDDLVEGSRDALTGGTTGTGTTRKPPTGGTDVRGGGRSTSGGTAGTVEKPTSGGPTVTTEKPLTRGSTGRKRTGGVTQERPKQGKAGTQERVTSPRTEGGITPVTRGTTSPEKGPATTTTQERPTRTTKRGGGGKGKKKGGSK